MDERGKIYKTNLQSRWVQQPIMNGPPEKRQHKVERKKERKNNARTYNSFASRGISVTVLSPNYVPSTQGHRIQRFRFRIEINKQAGSGPT